jgi:hypothetical protein
MSTKGNLLKMRVEVESPVGYYLPLSENEIHLNPLVGHRIRLKHNGVINCIFCGKKTAKSYSQGYCYNCMLVAPEADQSVIRPELSMAQHGIARDMEWAAQNDLIDHFVYLSITSDMKVGVTRNYQLFTRWIDQGAVEAIKFARTPNRHIAGIIELFLKRHVADKTNWLKMLKGEAAGSYNLADEKVRLGGLLPGELQKYLDEENTAYLIEYPIQFIPPDMKQTGFDNSAEIEGLLAGIKGQYLIFDDGRVFNVRKHNGYFTDFDVIA